MSDYRSLLGVLGRFVENHINLVAREKDHQYFRRQSLSFTNDFHDVESAGLEHIYRLNRESSNLEVELGMNSPGILLDRVTILAIKKIMLNDDRAIADVDEALVDMLAVFEGCGYEKRHLLKKQSVIELELSGFGHALLHLLASNLRMWLSQEIFYLGVAPEDLGYTVNDFVQLWGFENQFRNACIDKLELLFMPCV